MLVVLENTLSAAPEASQKRHQKARNVPPNAPPAQQSVDLSGGVQTPHIPGPAVPNPNAATGVPDGFFNGAPETGSSSSGTFSFTSLYRKYGMNQYYEKISEAGTNISPEFIKNAKHPGVCAFHLLFKALCLGVYLFGTWVVDNMIIIYIVCILLLAFDFWTVKNVSGRLLV